MEELKFEIACSQERPGGPVIVADAVVSGAAGGDDVVGRVGLNKGRAIDHRVGRVDPSEIIIRVSESIVVGGGSTVTVGSGTTITTTQHRHSRHQRGLQRRRQQGDQRRRKNALTNGRRDRISWW